MQTTNTCEQDFTNFDLTKLNFISYIMFTKSVKNNKQNSQVLNSASLVKLFIKILENFLYVLCLSFFNAKVL